MIKTNNTTNLKNILKYLLTTTLTLGLLSATNTVIANQNSTIDNYNTRYTPQGRIKAKIRFSSVKTFKTRISIPRQISFIINIHIHHTSSSLTLGLLSATNTVKDKQGYH
jgi:ABC-type antimicrobial peptide transport system permease subunit